MPTPLPDKFPAPARRALASIGVESIEQLADFTERQLLEVHGFGPKAIVLLAPAMGAAQVKFKPS